MKNYREASEASDLYCYLPRNIFGWYVKTTMRMLTILREAEEWRACIYQKPACCSLVHTITKSSLYVRQNYKAHAHHITLLSLAP